MPALSDGLLCHGFDTEPLESDGLSQRASVLEDSIVVAGGLVKEPRPLHIPSVGHNGCFPHLCLVAVAFQKSGACLTSNTQPECLSQRLFPTLHVGFVPRGPGWLALSHVQVEGSHREVLSMSPAILVLSYG